MGKEAKIGLAIILVLLITFGVVLGRRLSGAGDDPLASSEQSQKDHAKSNATDLMPKPTPTFESSSKPFLVASKPPLTETAQHAPDGTSRLNVVSDDRKPSADQGMPMQSYLPKAPPPPAEDAADHDASNTNQPWIPQMNQTSGSAMPGSNAAAGGAPYDPLRSQAAPSAAGPPLGGQASNPVRTLDAPPTADPGGYGPSQYQYGSSLRNEIAAPPQVPTLRESSRYDYPPATLTTPMAQQMTVSSRSSLFEQPPTRTESGEYEVQPNDNYWTISRKLYGSGAYFKALAEHNRSRVPQEDQLAVGDVISAPSVEELEKGYADLCPKPSRREAVRSLAQAASTRLPYGGGRTYVVQEGDTLYDIARYELGKASRWAEIHALNAEVLGKDYDYLVPGTRLALPADDRPSETLTSRPGTGSIYQR